MNTVYLTAEQDDDRARGACSEPGVDPDALLVGCSEEFRQLGGLIEMAGSVEAPVLITGETGTGKSLIARAIHLRRSPEDAPFVNVNCAALPETLIEAELFGHEKGSFTGAVQSRRGLFEMAEGGTLLLDEIGEMPPRLQTKLLGVLEDKQVRRIGGETPLPINARVVAATCVDLDQDIDRRFRRDLYYRLSVIRIHVPPLREHPEDLPLLCRHILKKVGDGRALEVSPRELSVLSSYEWPGNIRELRNLLEREAIYQRGPELHPSRFLSSPQRLRSPGEPELSPPPSLVPLAEVENSYIRFALRSLDGNFSRTSRVLGISLSTLKRRVHSLRHLDAPSAERARVQSTIRQWLADAQDGPAARHRVLEWDPRAHPIQ